MLRKYSLTLGVLFAFCLAPQFAYAAGFSAVTSLVDTITDNLRTITVATITLVAVIVGYKVIFGGNTIRECLPFIIGGSIIVCASEIGNLFS